MGKPRSVHDAWWLRNKRSVPSRCPGELSTLEERSLRARGWAAAGHTDRGQTNPVFVLGGLTPHYLSLYRYKETWVKSKAEPCPSPGLPAHGSANGHARTRAEGLRGTQGSSCPAFNSTPPSCSRMLVKMSYLMLVLMKFYDEKVFSEGRREYFKTIIQILFWSDTF